MTYLMMLHYTLTNSSKSDESQDMFRVMILI